MVETKVNLGQKTVTNLFITGHMSWTCWNNFIYIRCNARDLCTANDSLSIFVNVCTWKWSDMYLPKYSTVRNKYFLNSCLFKDIVARNPSTVIIVLPCLSDFCLLSPSYICKFLPHCVLLFWALPQVHPVDSPKILEYWRNAFVFCEPKCLHKTDHYFILLF